MKDIIFKHRTTFYKKIRHVNITILKGCKWWFFFFTKIFFEKKLESFESFVSWCKFYEILLFWKYLFYFIKSVQESDFIKRIGTQSGGLAKIEKLAGTKTRGFLLKTRPKKITSL
jgi:hypothetical protein